MLRKVIYIPTGLASFGISGLAAYAAVNNPFLGDKERQRLAVFSAGSFVAGTACIRTAFRKKYKKCKCQDKK